MVCIIADGREKVNQRVLDMLSVLGVYQEGIAKSKVDKQAVHAHLYEVKFFPLFISLVSTKHFAYIYI